MAGKKCFEFIVKDKVQDVGLRLAIAKQIPDELDVRTDNLPDGSVRVVVRGQKQEVMRFWEQLQKQVLAKVENPTFSEPEGITPTAIETDRFFHKLQCEQMEKFVSFGLDMHNDMKGMHNDMKDMRSDIKGVQSDVRGMREDIRGMHNDVKDLPKNMAKEIAKLNRNSLL